jgi:hypothetical protein
MKNDTTTVAPGWSSSHPYLVADSVASYCTDYIDGESVEAIFEPSELAEGLTFRQSISPDLMGLLREWTLGFCPLNHIERSLSDLIDARQAHPVQRTTAVVTAQGAGHNSPHWSAARTRSTSPVLRPTLKSFTQSHRIFLSWSSR